MSKGRGFPQLLGDPGIGRMTGYCDMDDFSALQFNDEEGKERTEEEVRDGQEVAGPDLMCMVMQEGGPRLRGGSCAFRAHVLLNGAFGDVNAQLEQFSANALGSPQAIVPGHGFDQRDGLGSDFGFL